MCAKKVKPAFELKKIKKILIIYWGCYGELVEAEPFFRFLRRKFLTAKINAVIGDWDNKGLPTARVLKFSNLFDRVIDYSPAILRKIVLSGSYDLVIDLCANQNSKLLVRLSSAKLQISGDFRINPKNFVFVNQGFKKIVLVDKVSRVRQFFSIAKLFGASSIDQPQLKITAKESYDAQCWIKKNLKGQGPLVVIHPFGKKFGLPSRLWPDSGYKILVKKLKQKGCRLVVAGSLAERFDIENLIKDSGCGVKACFLDIRKYLGLISCADLFISGDGGPLHMASAVSVRSLGIFYSRDSANYWYDVSNRLALTPVFLNRHQALEKQVEKVWKSVIKILNK